MIPSLFISGQSNTGKTTLINKIIRNLSDLGLTIAVLKHSSSSIQGETEGKDTWNYRVNGAVATAVSSKNLTAIFHHGHIVKNPVELAQSIFRKQTYESEKTIDLILIEGYKNLDYPKIALPLSKEDAADFTGAIAYVLPESTIGKSSTGGPLGTGENNPTACGKPLFYRNDTEKICRFIHNWWQSERCKNKVYCRVFLSDDENLPINEYTAITLNRMLRGLLSELRGYSDSIPFKVKCSERKLSIHYLAASHSLDNSEKQISVKPFIAEMICHSLTGFLSSLKDTEGKLSNFIIEIPPVLL
jgi:molybdopterin-guanine dinucleotide biosynthesis protein B